MFKPPAHKSGTAGQTINREPRITVPKYLHEEIERMQKEKKPKRNFEQWWYTDGNSAKYYRLTSEEALAVWIAAQENA